MYYILFLHEENVKVFFYENEQFMREDYIKVVSSRRDEIITNELLNEMFMKKSFTFPDGETVMCGEALKPPKHIYL